MIKNSLPIIRRFMFSASVILVVALLVLNVTLPASAAYVGSFVDDGANLLSESEIQKLNKRIQKTYDDYSIGLFFLTTNDTDDKTAMEYADDYLDNLIDNEGFPENSALLLIDMGSRFMWISTTGMMIAAVNDADIDEILDGAAFYAKEGDFYEAADFFANQAILNFDSYKDSKDEYYPSVPNIGGEKNDPIFGGDKDYYGSPVTPVARVGVGERIVFAACGAVIVFFIAFFTIKSRYKNNGKASSPNMHRTNLRLTRKADTLVSRTVTHTVIQTPPPPPESKGGTHSHGPTFSASSTHVSSSGHTHGGGGRSF